LAFQFEIAVGQAERHLIAFEYAQWVGRVTISLDGRRVVRDWRDLLPFSYTRQWTISVGVQEHHHVLIRKIKQKRLYAGALAQAVIVFVDGNQVGEYRTR
jgi:hypothetical protein